MYGRSKQQLDWANSHAIKGSYTVFCILMSVLSFAQLYVDAP